MKANNKTGWIFNTAGLFFLLLEYICIWLEADHIWVIAFMILTSACCGTAVFVFIRSFKRRKSFKERGEESDA